MTAIMIATMGSAALTAASLDSTITVGNDLWFDAGTEDSFFGYGFNDALADPLSLATIGSITNDTWIDGSSISRVVSHVLYSDYTGALVPTLEDSIFFGIVGGSIPDTDLTFREIEYNGTTYTRASATNSAVDIGGVVTYWQWLGVSPNGPISGVRTFLVNL